MKEDTLLFKALTLLLAIIIALIPIIIILTLTT